MIYTGLPILSTLECDLIGDGISTEVKMRPLLGERRFPEARHLRNKFHLAGRVQIVHVPRSQNSAPVLLLQILLFVS